MLQVTFRSIRFYPIDRHMKAIRRSHRQGPLHVACIVETSMAFGRGILRGIAQYLRETNPWTVYVDQRSLSDPAPPWLRAWDGDGIISRLPPQETRRLRRSGIPIVDLNDQGQGRRRPIIECDHHAEGTMAAQHLIERGFKSFAFLGYAQFDWSRSCCRGFRESVEAAGHDCFEYRQSQRVSWGHQQISWEAEVESVACWIKSLPKPLGLMTCNDFRGVQALDACRRAGVAVPEEAAVIGVDNEEVACELAYPPLSTVIPDTRTVGYEAAAMLDRLMKGEAEPTTRIIVPPLGIAHRLSTDVNAIADPMVAEAMRFIREHASQGLRIDDVLSEVAVSRSVLQRRFRAILGRTVHQVITSVRIQRVKQMLLETDLPLSTIAERCGFVHNEYLSVMFRKATGSPPATYRRKHSPKGRAGQ